MATRLIKDHHLWTRDTIKNVSGDITLDIDGDIIADLSGGNMYFDKDGTRHGQIYIYTSTLLLSTMTNYNLRLATLGTGDIQLAPAGDCIIDRDTALTATGTAKGLHIDYDHDGISASGQTVTGIGLDIDMNCETVTHVGAVHQTAIDIDVVSAADGVQVNTGLEINCSGGSKAFGITIDTNVGTGLSSTGIYMDNKNGGVDFKNVSSADSSDYFAINTIASGVTEILTNDDGGAAAHLTLVPDGDLVLDPVSTKVIINATDGLYLDGGGDTYIYETSADTVRHVVGNDIVMVLKENGNSGNTVNFLTSCAGFTQFEPTYDATDTNVFFVRQGNKGHLTFTSASETIVDVHLFFPAVSCNCLLLIKQHASGGGAVTNWKTFDFEGVNESTVVWAGGSAPTLTTGGGKIDIMSFYWDEDNKKAYGVASLNF